MKSQPEIESRIRERLDEIKEIPTRNPQAAARGRARFLTQAAIAREAQHQKERRPIFRMQQFAMNMVVAVSVIVALLVGGGTTVKAAQDELPGQPLYGIKTFSEDISLQFQSTPESKVDLLMKLAQTRVQEMTRLVEAGQTPPEQVNLRLEQHLQQALQICSNMGDPALDQELPRVRNQLQQQESDIQRLRTHAAQNAQPTLEHTYTMLQMQLQVVNGGVQDHALFRSVIHNGMPYGQIQPPPTAVLTITSTPPQEQAGQATPPPDSQGNGNGVGPETNPIKPQPHVTPTPKNNHPTPGNNAGGKDKDKGKDPKDNKDPKGNKPATKTPK